MRLSSTFAVVALAVLAGAAPGDYNDPDYRRKEPLPGRSRPYTRPDPRDPTKEIVDYRYSDDWLPGHRDAVEDWERGTGSAGQINQLGDSTQRRKDRKYGSLPKLPPHPVTGVSRVKDENNIASFADPNWASTTRFRAQPHPESGGYSKPKYKQDHPNDRDGAGYDRFSAAQAVYKDGEERRTGTRPVTTEGGLAAAGERLMKTGGYSGATLSHKKGWSDLDRDQRRAHESPARVGTSYRSPSGPPINPEARKPYVEGGGRQNLKKDPYWDEGLDPKTRQPLSKPPGSYVYPEPKRANTYNPTDRSKVGIPPPSDRYSSSRYNNLRPQDNDHYARMKANPPPPNPPMRRPSVSQDALAADLKNLRLSSPDRGRESRGRDRDSRPPTSNTKFFETQGSSRPPQRSSSMGPAQSSSKYRESDPPKRSSSKYRDSSDSPPRRSSSRYDEYRGGSTRVTQDGNRYVHYDERYDPARPLRHSAPSNGYSPYGGGNCYRKRNENGQVSTSCSLPPKGAAPKPDGKGVAPKPDGKGAAPVTGAPGGKDKADKDKTKTNTAGSPVSPKNPGQQGLPKPSAGGNPGAGAAVEPLPGAKPGSGPKPSAEKPSRIPHLSGKPAAGKLAPGKPVALAPGKPVALAPGKPSAEKPSRIPRLSGKLAPGKPAPGKRV